MRNTIKAYLKTVEKSRTDERAKSATAEETPTLPNMAEESATKDSRGEQPRATTTGEQQSIEVTKTEDTPAAVDVQPSIEVSYLLVLFTHQPSLIACTGSGP